MDGSFQTHMGASQPRPRRIERLAVRVLNHLECGTLEITFPSGARALVRGRHQTDGLYASMQIHRMSALVRMLRHGAMGLAEGYMAGDWSSERLTGLLSLLAANMDALEARLPGWTRVRVLERLKHFANRNNRAGSRRNIAYHYDLGNDFYRLWLDDGMTYSSALYSNAMMSLDAAQASKYRALADAVGLKAGDHVLEIGCGWGGFAEYAARERGCRVTGVTLSREQLAYAEHRIAEAGLSDRVELKLMDYRDLEGRFDHIVSIEMLEAVGEAW